MRGSSPSRRTASGRPTPNRQAVIVSGMITACLFGVGLPLAVRLLGLDPRIAAGPLVLALSDLAALMFYFTLAERVAPTASPAASSRAGPSPGRPGRSS